MANQLYVNKPGGVIAHTTDGMSVTLKYGEPVPDNLADYVDASRFADSSKRVADFDEQQAQDANRRAALAEGGQVNSSSSAVPSNYSDLDEDAAAQLVAALERFPGQQAEVLRYEVAFGGGRQKVIDAGSDAAKADAGLSKPIKDFPAEPTSTEPVNVENPGAAIPSSTPPPSGQSDDDPPSQFDDMSYEDMKAYIDATGADVPKNLSKDDMRARLKALPTS